MIYIIFSISSCQSATQRDGFTEATRGRKQRKAISSPTLPSQPKPGSSKDPLGTSVRPKPSIKNSIPWCRRKVQKLENANGRIETVPRWSQNVKELPKGDFVVIGDSVQDVIILQNESRMKAALGKNVKISLPKAFQTSNVQTKSLVIKGVPTDIKNIEFKEFLDLNKITYANAERLKSKKDGRVLPIFRLETNDPTEAEALISQNLVCQVTCIVYEVEEFRSPISVTQCFNC